MKINSLFKTNYIKADDLAGERKRLTIADVEVVTMGEGKDQMKKPVLRFDETDQGLVLNKTNANVLREKFGDDTDAWIGQTILLCPDETDFSGKRVPCIRIRVPENRSTGAKAPAAGGGDDEEAF